MSSPSYILVTGATGFIGAHVVAALLAKGVRVRSNYRSKEKAEAMRMHFRGIYGDKLKLDFVYTGDLASDGCFDEALKGGIDGIVHCASPLNFQLPPKDIIDPAIAGTKSLLKSIDQSPDIKKLVVLSSFAALVDERGKGIGPEVTYTSEDWNPVTYEEGLENLREAYHASKALSEKEVWKWSEGQKEKQGGGVAVVTLCPPLIFGPMAYPIQKISEMNNSNAELWFLTTGFSPFPKSLVPAWMDVHELATAHVSAILDPSIVNKRYSLASKEPFSTQLAADTIRELFDWGKERVAVGDTGVYPEDCKVEGEIAAKELGFEYTDWKTCMRNCLTYFKSVEDAEKRREAEREAGVAVGLEVKGAGM